MKFSTFREDILKPLQVVGGVIERRQTMPVLSNILLELANGRLTMTATDLEVELVSGIDIGDAADGRTTVPGKKFIDICKTLPEGAEFKFSQDSERVKIQSGKSRFTLSTLAADDFPLIDDIEKSTEVSITEGDLKRIISATQFSMAQQDVRYYLNGLLMEISRDKLTAVATDGHRLSMCQAGADAGVETPLQIIIPRKGVTEINRLLDDSDAVVRLKIGSNHIRVEKDDVRFTCKLVDGKFPDYQRVIPAGLNNVVTAQRDELRSALTRTSILSNEKYRGIRIQLSPDNIQATAHNPELEEAEENIAVSYGGAELEIGFNVNYIIDALGAIETDSVELHFGDANSSCLIVPAGQSQCKYVVMPMRL